MQEITLNKSNAFSTRGCPLLGLQGDRATRALFANIEHRCYANNPVRIELAHQSQFCLSDAYSACPSISRTDASSSEYGSSSQVVRPEQRSLLMSFVAGVACVAMVFAAGLVMASTVVGFAAAFFVLIGLSLLGLSFTESGERTFSSIANRPPGETEKMAPQGVHSPAFSGKDPRASL